MYGAGTPKPPAAAGAAGATLAATGFTHLGILLLGIACLILGLALLRHYLVRRV